MGYPTGGDKGAEMYSPAAAALLAAAAAEGLDSAESPLEWSTLDAGLSGLKALPPIRL